MAEEHLICEYSGLRSLSFYLEQQEKEDSKRKMDSKEFSLEEIDRIIQMAWEDRTPFEAIEFQFGEKINWNIGIGFGSKGIVNIGIVLP